jgi:hypothetical protein
MDEITSKLNKISLSPKSNIIIYNNIDPFFLESKIIYIQKLWRQNKHLIINNNLKKFPKGKLCSINGNKYEKDIYNIVKKCEINGITFNTQKEEDLGGSSASNDIECNYKKFNDIGIEAKKYNTPDFMQCCLIYDQKLKKLIPSKKGKIPEKCRIYFEKLLKNINLYNGEIPPFLKKKLTHEEWKDIKSKTDKWNDCYFDIPNDSIKILYNFKGCNYIQISNGYGLYHLGEDTCNFKVSEFIIEQQLRVRTKIHTRKNNKGFCNISVTVACQPKKIELLNKSIFSLDNINKLPNNLIYKS